MRTATLASLENKIVRPGFERHLLPLVRYRGNLSLGDVHRVWNLFISAMEQECTFADITQRLPFNPEYSHLCGPEKVKQHMGLCGFLARLEDNTSVLGEMPGLEDYIRSLGGWRPRLTPVSQSSKRRRNMGAGGWRTLEKPKRAVSNVATYKPEPLVYPFLIHDGGRSEHALLRQVNAAVSRHFPPELRADICQDIIVGILSGEFSADNLSLPAKEMTKRVLKMFPTKYGMLSLDADIPGTDGLRLIDTLSEEDSIWNHI